MITLGGCRINENLQLLNGLQKIFGIGLNKSKQMFFLLNITKDIYIKDLKGNQLLKLNKAIIFYIHGFRLRRNLKNNLIRLFENKCYRGVRHSYFLSVRGQKTRTNAKTQKRKKIKK